ncbi:MAG: hypothetical protein CM15mP127_05020 [Gammaproteobacteria bacterium]|nr:MAG: hypothetical protein CM15mP127_05020 [Gammaproteobacteria bacterium]
MLFFDKCVDIFTHRYYYYTYVLYLQNAFTTYVILLTEEKSSLIHCSGAKKKNHLGGGISFLSIIYLQPHPFNSKII